MSTPSVSQTARRWAGIIFSLSRYTDPIDKFRARGTYVTGTGLILAGLLVILTNLLGRISAINTAATQDNLANFSLIVRSIAYLFPVAAVAGMILTRMGEQRLGAIAILTTWFISMFFNMLTSLTNVGIGISLFLVIIGISLGSLLVGKRATILLSISSVIVLVASLITGPRVSPTAISVEARVPFLFFYLILLLIQEIAIYWLANGLPAVVAQVRAESTNRLYQQARTNLSEIERLNRELIEANVTLQSLDQLKSRFIADVSHELRTPLASINLRLHLAQHDEVEKRDSHLETLQRQITQLNNILESILDFSQIDAVYQESAAFVPVNLNTVVEEVVATYHANAETLHLEMNFTPGSDLPQVPVDSSLLRRAIANLAMNAINYTTSGQINVRTLLDSARHEVCIEVQDTGMGIPSDDLPHLFEHFYRGQHVGSSNIPGMGLGLAIVKQIVDRHKGRIEVESQIDKGSSFRVWLPLA